MATATKSQPIIIPPVSSITPAKPPTSVYRPDLVRNGSLGLLLGVLVGVVFAYVYDVVSVTSGRVRN